jgi:uncharacterized protein YpuA (DUF1002 family)
MKKIQITWSTEDILFTAENMNVQLNEEEADTILDELDEHHDAQLGINWDIIENYIQQHIDNRQYPFQEGDEYWTIENGEIIWSIWDSVSEELYIENPQKKYFATDQEALEYLKSIN